MANPKITQQEIADALNISRTTVSKVFREIPVSPKIKETVLKKAIELGYISKTESLQSPAVIPNDYSQQSARILESIPDAFYAVNSEWEFLYVNKVTEQLWGKKRNDLIGHSLWQVFPNYINTEGSQKLQSAMTGRTQTSFETFSPYLKTYVEVNVYPSESGGLEVFFLDVTGKRLAEQMLWTSEQLLRLAIDASDVAFWRWDIEEDRLTPIYVSSKIPAYWHLGTIRESLVSVHPSDRDMVYDRMMKAKIGDHYECEFRRVLPGGKVAWIFSKGEVFENKHDGTTFMIGVNYDITDAMEMRMRKQALEFPDEKDPPVSGV